MAKNKLLLAFAFLFQILFTFPWPLAASGAPLDASKAVLIVDFQGRGTDLGWGTGISKALVENIPAVDENQVIVGGNSSGAVLAAYFACHGFSKESVLELRRRLLETDPRLVNEDTVKKFTRIAAGLDTEFPLKNLDEFIAVAMTDHFDAIFPSVTRVTRNSSIKEPFVFPESELCAPKLPVIITAANYEVLDTRAKGTIAGKLAAARMVRGVPPTVDKVFNEKNFSVSWKKEKFEELKRKDPSLKSAYIGKSCTYFVDQSLFDIIKTIPYEERLCNLRLIEDGEDLKFAIQASSAEPTYFYPMPEPDLEKIFQADFPYEPTLKKGRSYSGGFIVPTVVQDIRRVLTDLYALGSGWTPLTGNAQVLLREWQLIDVFEVAKLTEWWLDTSLIPPKTLDDQMLQNRQNPLSVRLKNLSRFAVEAEQFAEKCLKSGNCHPRFVRKPAFTKPVDGGEELKTMRGLETLLKDKEQVPAS